MPKILASFLAAVVFLAVSPLIIVSVAVRFFTRERSPITKHGIRHA